MSTTAPGVEILLIEDETEDIKLIKRAFSQNDFEITLSVKGNGKLALDYLSEKVQLKKQLPDLILLDLNMPLMNGKDTLGRLKSDSCYKKIPVIVMTSSESQQDVIQSYELGANCYIQKPVGLEELRELVEAIQGFWLSRVVLPRG